MNRDRTGGVAALLVIAGSVGGCAGSPVVSTSPTQPAQFAASQPCHTAEVSIAFDFEGASASRCIIEGARSFRLLITPEHAPPINPSPWYAFRYSATGTAPVSVTLDYVGARHRYAPKLTRSDAVTTIEAEVGEEGASAALSLPPGEGIVSGQPLVGEAQVSQFLSDVVEHHAARRVEIGRSLDGRPIEGLWLGQADAPRLVILLGRQHPPELTGSDAMLPFVDELARLLHADPVLAARYQVLAVPLLNPDGVALGHWRANRGGIDLNRDWGPFTQPETRAVRDLLATIPASIQPVAMIDFHSTQHNLFYVQGDEANAAQRRFLAAWLGGKESAFAAYPFTLEPRNANPGSGTSKNWFFETYDIPAYTFEVGDDTDPAATRSAARALAGTLLDALDEAAAVEDRP